MTQSFKFPDADYFRPENWFSADSPLFQAARKNQQFALETFEKAARANLELGSDLLELNRKRFDALSSGKSLADAVASEKELAVEAGSRWVSWFEEIGEIASSVQSFFGEAANEWAEPVRQSSRPTQSSKKAKSPKAA